MPSHACDPHYSRYKQGLIKPLRIEEGPVGGGYSIYGYTCLRVIFDDGSHFSTSNWMNPATAKTRKRLEEAFDLTSEKT